MNQSSENPYNLARFIEAQNPVYGQVCQELEQGHKLSHWMWFIFPQMEGLSASAVSRRFAISSLQEAESYINHPVLGDRLIECTGLVINVSDRTINQILGPIDSMKFRSCMTLFTHATIDNDLFKKALKKYFSGEYDRLTIEKLGL